MISSDEDEDGAGSSGSTLELAKKKLTTRRKNGNLGKLKIVNNDSSVKKEKKNEGEMKMGNSTGESTQSNSSEDDDDEDDEEGDNCDNEDLEVGKILMKSPKTCKNRNGTNIYAQSSSSSSSSTSSRGSTLSTSSSTMNTMTIETTTNNSNNSGDVVDGVKTNGMLGGLFGKSKSDLLLKKVLDSGFSSCSSQELSPKLFLSSSQEQDDDLLLASSPETVIPDSQLTSYDSQATTISDSQDLMKMDSGLGSQSSSTSIGMMMNRGGGVSSGGNDEYGSCIMCLTEPKNGVFVHSQFLHLCCCYKCAVKVWTKNKRCPVCNCKVKNVMKLFVH